MRIFWVYASILLVSSFLQAGEEPVSDQSIQPVFVEETAQDLNVDKDIEHIEDRETKILRIKFSNGSVIIFPDSPLTENQKQLFNSLTPEGKKRFLRNREWYLWALAGVMRLGNPVYKVGSPVARTLSPITNKLLKPYTWTKEKITASLEKMMGEKLRKAVEEAEKSQGEDEVRTLLSVPVREDLPSRERYRRGVQNVLRWMDQELWDHAPVLAEANEFFALGQVGGGGGAAVGDLKSHSGFIGVLGTNLMLAINPKEKRLSFTFLTDLDSLKKVVGVYGGGNLFTSLEFGIGRQDIRLPLETEKGKAVIPPGPFLGVFTPKTIQFGLGIGPNLLGANLPVPSYMETELHRYPLAKASFALTWPFFKFQVGQKPAKDFLIRSVSGTVTAVKTIGNLAIAPCRYAFRKVWGGSE